MEAKLRFMAVEMSQNANFMSAAYPILARSRREQ